jgi:hypothetical protein
MPSVQTGLCVRSGKGGGREGNLGAALSETGVSLWSWLQREGPRYLSTTLVFRRAQSKKAGHTGAHQESR